MHKTVQRPRGIGMTSSSAVPSLSGSDHLRGRTLYIPRMSTDGAALVAAAYRSVGVDGQLLPESDARSLDLARQYTNGDECYPELVTLGGCLKVTETPDFDPAKTAFLMPTANGPCRFGQYSILLKDILAQKGLEEIAVVSVSSADGYEGFGEQAEDLIRLIWWSLVCSDGLRKLLLQTRPYELTPGDTDRVHDRCLHLLSGVMECPDLNTSDRFERLAFTMGEVEAQFARVPADYRRDRPLISVVGEIYCRLDHFANADFVRRIERLGGEAWLANITEWAFFVNFMERMNLRAGGQLLSRQMLKAIIRERIQRRSEHRLLAPLSKRFVGYEEASKTKMLADRAAPYLPYSGAQGEMVLSVGGIIHMYEKGVDGGIDISPFSCMNGIICEAVYPRVSRDLDDLPIRVLFFDGTGRDYDRDVEIFLELANTYRRRKKVQRVYPDHFVH